MGLGGKAVIAGAVAVFAATGGHSAVGHAVAAAAGAARAASASGGTRDCAQLEALWKRAGGNPGDAFMAAEIAMAESGGNQYAHSKTDDVGYWQINAPVWGSLATYDAYGNAKAAVYISHDGADWYPWTTYTSGAYAGKC